MTHADLGIAAELVRELVRDAGVPGSRQVVRMTSPLRATCGRLALL
jgi:hypothetical protein